MHDDNLKDLKARVIRQ